MKITHGLLKGQVLQRDTKNVASAKISGECVAAGPVEVRVAKGSRVLRGFAWQRIGKAADGRFACTLAGVPCGGPYTVELRICSGAKKPESVAVNEVFVGDVWFMGGQSNMQGIGLMADAPKPHPMVRCFYVRDEWGMAKDPLHFLSEAVDMTHHLLVGRNARPTEEQLRQERANTLVGVGVGVYFGIEMVKRAGVPQGLVACAHGGTSMAQWSPKLKSEGGNSLYGAMLRRFEKLGQPMAGLLWYQGESDAATPDGYTERMEELIAATRADFGQPNLPWIVVQIGRVVGGGWNGGPWNSVQEQQRRLPEKVKHLDVVPTIDLELDDSIHISGKSYALLGKRMACAAGALALGNKEERGGIQLKKIQTVVVPPTKATPAITAVEVTFSNVVGGLTSVGRPVGFCLSNSLGEPISGFYKTRLLGSKVLLQTVFGLPSLEQMTLYYGIGCDPTVNITDARGMGLPMMGPVQISPPTGTPFLLKWQAAPAEGAKDVSSVRLADAERVTQWSEAALCALPEGPWLVMPKSIQEPRSGVFFMRASVEAAQAIRAKLAFGADSPFRLWLNGAEVLHDVKATNPCFPDEYKTDVTLKQGTNQIVVAFDVRNGQGWGICARFRPVSAKSELPKGMIQVQ